ncbi:hypothetical protein BDW75DRAFT_225748, partial [Aspergillus navahoensis]
MLVRIIIGFLRTSVGCPRISNSWMRMSKWYPTSAICGCGYDFDIQRSGFAAA